MCDIVIIIYSLNLYIYIYIIVYCIWLEYYFIEIVIEMQSDWIVGLNVLIRWDR